MLTLLLYSNILSEKHVRSLSRKWSHILSGANERTTKLTNKQTKQTNSETHLADLLYPRIFHFFIIIIICYLLPCQPAVPTHLSFHHQKQRGVHVATLSPCRASNTVPLLKKKERGGGGGMQAITVSPSPCIQHCAPSEQKTGKNKGGGGGSCMQ